MFQINNFINYINKENEKKQKIESFYFSFVLGFVLLYISILGFIADSNISHDIIYIFLLCVSLINFIFLLFFPNKINFLKMPLSITGKIVFRILMSLLLIVIYVIWFIPSSFINYYKNRNIVINTTFVKCNQKIIKVSNNNTFIQLKNIFSYFIFEGSWYLIPLLIVLLIIGLILIFAQSSAITPLIYPLI